MDKKLLKNIPIVFLAAITIFSVFKYVAILKEKQDLLKSLNQTKEQVAALEEERQNLLQELEKEKALEQKLNAQNTGLKDYLKASRQRLTKLFTALASEKKANAQLAAKNSYLRAKFSLLDVEHAALLENKEQLVQENATLKAKLGSIAELKKAIKELKKRARKIRGQTQQNIQEDKQLKENHGYVIKGGQPDYPAKVKIEVTPAPAKEQ